MWDPRHFITIWTSTVYYRNSFTELNGIRDFNPIRRGNCLGTHTVAGQTDDMGLQCALGRGAVDRWWSWFMDL
jgi:hypothetical protein